MTSRKVCIVRIGMNEGRVDGTSENTSAIDSLASAATRAPLPHRYTHVRFLQTFLRFIRYKTYTCKHEHALIHIYARSHTYTMNERATQESFHRRTRGVGTRREGNEDRQTEHTHIGGKDKNSP